MQKLTYLCQACTAVTYLAEARGLKDRNLLGFHPGCDRAKGQQACGCPLVWPPSPHTAPTPSFGPGMNR